MAETIGPVQAVNSVLEPALAEHGLSVRGRVLPGHDAALPETGLELTDGGNATAICLVGHGGGGFWPIFAAWRRAHPNLEEPLDGWSKAVIGPIAAAAGGEAVFPSDRPWRPFQQWAMAAEGLKASPLGMLIHPDYGLWHGYRGAILFGAAAVAKSGWTEAAVPATRPANHPCDACLDKPCLTHCPVGAFTRQGLVVSACRDHLKSDTGQRGCMVSGCRAREACPVGRNHRYGTEQIRFHMRAFA